MMYELFDGVQGAIGESKASLCWRIMRGVLKFIMEHL